MKYVTSDFWCKKIWDKPYEIFYKNLTCTLNVLECIGVVSARLRRSLADVSASLPPDGAVSSAAGAVFWVVCLVKSPSGLVVLAEGLSCCLLAGVTWDFSFSPGDLKEHMETLEKRKTTSNPIVLILQLLINLLMANGLHHKLEITLLGSWSKEGR